LADLGSDKFCQSIRPGTGEIENGSTVYLTQSRIAIDAIQALSAILSSDLLLKYFMDTPALDAIHLTGIRAYGYTGALPEEHVLGQWFEAEITLYLDLSLACQSDHLPDTHNYCTVVEQTQRILREQRFALIERLAGEIAQTALVTDDRLQRVRVKVTKPTPPIPDFSGQVAVEITRDRMQG
jgi:7,8-dihydroneopterin aldolase/epimerase/oxygenase